ncbi:MAG: hypothetical protein LUC44_03505 [Prevotellaceae bacterium]|nr:hypothetical protein [Prevotellaceae bacterium]
MKWNEYAKVGDALIKAFRRAVGRKVTECDFAFEILDRLKMEDGYKLVALKAKQAYRLHAVPADMVDILWKIDPDAVDECDKYYYRDHLIVERSAMGAWQETVLGEVVFALPSRGWAVYDDLKFIFSTAALSSLKGKGQFDYRVFLGDPRIVPSVEMNGDEVVIRRCYWNDWQGLVLCTDYGRFERDFGMVYGRREEETIFEYDCGEVVSDFDNSRLSVRRVRNENGSTSVQAVIKRERGGCYYVFVGSSSDEDELSELEDEAMELIDGYDEHMRDLTRQSDVD